MKLVIKNVEIVDVLVEYPKGCDILVEDGIIKSICPGMQEQGAILLDGTGLVVLPGFVDMHTHLREPGFEHKETVLTGTQAAARGGYTTICCMPNTKPVIDSPDSLQLLMDIIRRDAAVNVYPIAAISLGQRGEALTDMKKLKGMGAIAFSDDGQPVSSESLMKEALRTAKEHELLIIDHCEDHSLVQGGVINEGRKSEELGLKGISSLSEEKPVTRDIELAAEENCKIHIAHVSTKGTVEAIREAKKKSIRVSCEATPHHIALCDEIITMGHTDCKVNPPLRCRADVDAIKLGLADGTIDVIATDHAPHHESEKGEDFNHAAFGISGIETAFTVCYSELVETGLLTLRELAAKMSYNPSKLLGISKGRVAVGYAADLALVDLSQTVEVQKSKLISKGKNTPFHGRRYKGEVVHTLVQGKIVK